MILESRQTSFQQRIDRSRGASQTFQTLIDQLPHSFIGGRVHLALIPCFKRSNYSNLLKSLDRCEGTLQWCSCLSKIVQQWHHSVQRWREVRSGLNSVQKLTSMVGINFRCRVKHRAKHEKVRNYANGVGSCLQLLIGKTIFAFTQMQRRWYGYGHGQAQHTSPELRPGWVQRGLFYRGQSASYRVLDLYSPLHRRHDSPLVVSGEHSATAVRPPEIAHG